MKKTCETTSDLPLPWSNSSKFIGHVSAVLVVLSGFKHGVDDITRRHTNNNRNNNGRNKLKHIVHTKINTRTHTRIYIYACILNVF